jgi:hypothetical protein
MDQFKNIKGGEELQRFLDELPVKMEKNIMRGALRQGANVIKAEAQHQLASNGNIKTGILSKGLKVSTNAKGGTVTASIKAKGKHAFIAYWLEFTGASPHMIRGKYGLALAFAGGVYKQIEHPGFQPKPFMRPALDSKASQAVIAVGNRISQKLTAEGINAPDIEIEEA